ncbi:uncharacterized protein LOC115038680 [Echeneis naucrates]|uniref:uncharacterized protein LOC115038680 n=1 Tax=Echeneis naucrates TaxID=173247 RepID=UPI0011136EDA|nr:uncharacterized protein LOC115038680 [Echeneis naucrates]
MSLTTASSGFVVVVLTVTAIHSQNTWTVTYSATQICAVKGSTVEINCNYRYPSRINGQQTKVEETFWFAKGKIKDPVDLKTDSEYSGRVQYDCGQNDCTLRITDLRESDSAEYKFRFTTNQPGGKYTGSPGVTLSVTEPDLQVKLKNKNGFWGTLECHSSCRLPEHPSYIWYKNGQKTGDNTVYFSASFSRSDSVSCALKGYEDFPSPSVCEFTSV